jgi:hypothetical protein
MQIPVPDPSLERAQTALTGLAAEVRKFTEEAKVLEQLRTRKIKSIQHLLYVLVPAMILLLIMAVTNFALLSQTRAAANDARRTNELLVSCFQPNTPCSSSSAQRTGDALNQIRQTQFVIAYCQRQNPVGEDPDGKDLVTCVQGFYPGFKLPLRAG